MVVMFVWIVFVGKGKEYIGVGWRIILRVVWFVIMIILDLYMISVLYFLGLVILWVFFVSFVVYGIKGYLKYFLWVWGREKLV